MTEYHHRRRENIGIFCTNNQCKYPSYQVRKGLYKSLSQTVEPSNEQDNQDNYIDGIHKLIHGINTVFDQIWSSIDKTTVNLYKLGTILLFYSSLVSRHNPTHTHQSDLTF